MSKFKKGDVVLLKSGGYKMTVSNVDGSTIECTWHVDPKARKAGDPMVMVMTFDEELLDIAAGLGF